MNATEKILVIKLEDLTGFVMAFAAMKQIRAAHERAHITLLTTPAFGPIAKASGYFNAVDVGGDMESLSLSRAIKKKKFDRVYDLEDSQKTAKIYSLMWPFRPPWTGHGALRDKTPGLGAMHILERHASLQCQLKFPDDRDACTSEFYAYRTCQSSKAAPSIFSRLFR